MFRKTDKNPQLDLFATPSNILPKRAQKKYTDEKAWGITSSSSWLHPRLTKNPLNLYLRIQRWGTQCLCTYSCSHASSRKALDAVMKTCLRNASLTFWHARPLVWNRLMTNCHRWISTICLGAVLQTMNRELVPI